MCWNRNTIISFEKEVNIVNCKEYDYMLRIDKNAHWSGPRRNKGSKGISRVHTDPIEHSDNSTDTSKIEELY